MRCLNYKAKTVFFLYNLIIFVFSLAATLQVNINITPRAAAVQRRKKRGLSHVRVYFAVRRRKQINQNWSCSWILKEDKKRAYKGTYIVDICVRVCVCMHPHCGVGADGARKSYPLTYSKLYNILYDIGSELIRTRGMILNK